MKTEAEVRDLLQKIEVIADRVELMDGKVRVGFDDFIRFEEMSSTLKTLFISLNWLLETEGYDKPDDGYATLEQYVFKSSQFLDKLNEHSEPSGQPENTSRPLR